jgi:hypothetical protein
VGANVALGIVADLTMLCHPTLNRTTLLKVGTKVALVLLPITPTMRAHGAASL